MATLFNPTDRARLVERIQSLEPTAERRWGTLHLPKALSHMGDQLAMALGDIEVPAIRSVLSLPPLRFLVVHVLPVPRGVKTAPALLQTDIGELDEARRRLLGLIERFVANGPDGTWSPHPLFGSLSGKDWGVLGAKHLNHHLKQFGA